MYMYYICICDMCIHMRGWDPSGANKRPTPQAGEFAIGSPPP